MISANNMALIDYKMLGYRQHKKYLLKTKDSKFLLDAFPNKQLSDVNTNMNIYLFTFNKS